MARNPKSTAVEEIAEEFRSSSAAVLTEYRGLTVAQLKELRRSLGGNATYAVVKNTLTKIAAKDAGVDGLDDLLVGPSAIAFVKGDPVEAAKGLRDFAKVHPNLVIDALTKGADGVIICGCHMGDCHYLSGNEKAENRKEAIELLLEDFGLEPERFRLEWVSASEGPRFAEVIREMTDEVRSLGPSPYRA